MKEVLQFLAAIPTPNPTTGLSEAINQHAQVITDLTRIVDQQGRTIQTLQLWLLFTAIVVVAMTFVYAYALKQFTRRIHRLEVRI